MTIVGSVVILLILIPFKERIFLSNMTYKISYLIGACHIRLTQNKTRSTQDHLEYISRSEG